MFFNHAQLPPVVNTPILCQMKGLMEIHNRGKFHECSFCGCQVMNIQKSSQLQKVPFLGPFGWFFGHNFPKWRQILFKFGTAMQDNIVHHIYYGFSYSAENSKELAQKPHFVVGIRTFLDHALFFRMGDAPLFWQMKGLMDIHNPSNFHGYSTCGYQVVYLQSFLYQQKVAFWAAFGWFFVDYNPKSSQICTRGFSATPCERCHEDTQSR